MLCCFISEIIFTLLKAFKTWQRLDIFKLCPDMLNLRINGGFLPKKHAVSFSFLRQNCLSLNGDGKLYNEPF